jgi:hypothetical protein
VLISSVVIVRRTAVDREYASSGAIHGSEPRLKVHRSAL